ncbi:coiled-coil domain-containing protein 60-like [Clarias gariepinus]|uniref:coiled-coil domain-containing protein 60-like n=1 Tax=Clarias gariepinus TaxID=13013 RepID=UPI00234CFA73|nr:coiled-coil domain-containing protein 60-like [Clarias gariepinus]
MQQTVQPCQISDPVQSFRIKELYVNPNMEEEFWEKFHHKHKQVFGEVKEVSHLETNKADKAPKIEICIASEVVCHSTASDSLDQNKDLPLKRSKSQKRGDTDNLWKHLRRSRKLVAAVKQGSSYFQLLQEQEEQKNEKRRKKEERRRTALHHPSSLTDSEIENEEERQSNRRRGRRPRPFTPVHQSLASDQPQQLSEEHVYRQLCCLCWLLEALTRERPGNFGPVASCWDPKEPGQSRNSLKAMNREKLIQAKWERFISPPKSLRPVIRLSRITSLTHKSPALSTVASSVLTSSLPGNASSCDVTFAEEERECPSVVMSEADPPISKYLQKLLNEVHQSVSNELYGSTTETDPETDTISFDTLSTLYSTQDSTISGKLESHTSKCSERSLASTVFSYEKAAMLEEMKLMFKEEAHELSMNLTDTLDLKAKKRWMRGVQRYQSLSNMSASPCQMSSVMCVTPCPLVQDSNIPDTPYSTVWLSTLLSSLSAHTHSTRKLECVLKKLKRYTQERTLRIRPHVFLRVLNSLQPWELCCPELCVAIEIVRENAVRMSTEDYDCWLQSKVDLPQSVNAFR